MTEVADPGRGSTPWVARFWSILLLGAVGLATVGAALLGAASPLLAVLPVGLLVAAFVVAQVPLRQSVALVLFLTLSLDVPSDAAGLWHTPFVLLGDLLQGSLDRYVSVLKLSGLELLVILFLIVSAVRSAQGSTLDAAGRVPTARILRSFLLLYLAGVAFAEINGLARGLGAVPWKARNLVQIPVFFLLFQSAFRGSLDHGLIAKVVVASAAVKAGLAIYVQTVFAPTTGGPLDYATSHGDSVLFAVAAFVLIAQLAEHPGRARLQASILLLPLLVWGMVANGRRIVWVMLGMTLVVLYLISPTRPWKRRLSRAALILGPLAALYVGIGWSNPSGVFSPLRPLRTMSDGSVDASTLWREIENWNISMSIQEHPLLGLGMGGEYTEFRVNGDLTAFYPEYRGWPHNSVLGLLLLFGVVAFTAIWLLHAVAVFLAARSYHRAVTPDDRVAALTVIATVIACIALAYGDLGANFIQYRVFTALALAVAGKLAVSTGAWPEGPPAREATPVSLGTPGTSVTPVTPATSAARTP